MAECRHGFLTTSEGIHIPYQWSYADAAARTGASGFAATDVGKLAYQEDTDTLWILTAVAPTWQAIAGAGFDDTEGDPTAIEPDDAAADGVSGNAARRDHQHQFTCGTPVDTGTANAEGNATTSARSNHVHKLHNHDHTGDAGDGGQISHDTALTNVSADDHHAQDHKDRHDPADGADPLDTAAAAEIAGVQAAGVGTSHSLARADHAHQIQHGIADNHLVTVDHVTPVATDYARFTAAGLEGREPSEVRTDLGLVIGTNVLAEQTIGIADDNLVEVDGPAAGAPASGEYARWTAAGLEGRQKTEVLSDLNVADGADVTGSNPPQAHKDRHDPVDGADPLDTEAPVDTGTANAAGSSHKFVKADHVHKLHDHLHAGVAGDGGQISHASLTNLVAPADDHTQYLLADATRGLSAPWTPGQIITLPNAGLHLLEAGAAPAHDLVVSPGSELTADRVLTLTTGDAARTITLSGNPTLADWFDQAVKQASSPTFADVFLADGGQIGISGNELLEVNAAGYFKFIGCAAKGVGIGVTPFVPAGSVGPWLCMASQAPGIAMTDTGSANLTRIVSQSAGNLIFGKCDDDGANPVTLNVVMATGDFRPGADISYDLGYDPNYAWDDVWCDDVHEHADLLLLDHRKDKDGSLVEIDDLAVIQAIKPSGEFNKRSGLPIIDDASLPEWMLTRNKRTGEISYCSTGRPFVAHKVLQGLTWGAIRQLAERIEILEEGRTRG